MFSGVVCRVTFPLPPRRGAAGGTPSGRGWFCYAGRVSLYWLQVPPLFELLSGGGVSFGTRPGTLAEIAINPNNLDLRKSLSKSVTLALLRVASKDW